MYYTLGHKKKAVGCSLTQKMLCSKSTSHTLYWGQMCPYVHVLMWSHKMWPYEFQSLRFKWHLSPWPRGSGCCGCVCVVTCLLSSAVFPQWPCVKLNWLLRAGIIAPCFWKETNKRIVNLDLPLTLNGCCPVVLLYSSNRTKECLSEPSRVACL